MKKAGLRWFCASLSAEGVDELPPSSEFGVAHIASDLTRHFLGGIFSESLLWDPVDDGFLQVMPKFSIASNSPGNPEPVTP